MGENKILQMSWGIIKDKDDPQSYILGILTVFKLGFNDMAFSLSTVPLTNYNFCASCSSHTHKTISIFWRKGPRGLKQEMFALNAALASTLPLTLS